MPSQYEPGQVTVRTKEAPAVIIGTLDATGPIGISLCLISTLVEAAIVAVLGEY